METKNLSITLRKRIINFLNAGMKAEPSLEVQEKLHLAFLINFLAISMMLIFAAEALFRGSRYYALILFILAILVIINTILIHYSGKERLFYNVSVWLMTVLCMYLLSTGGINNTGIIWCYVFPLISLYLLGMDKGSIPLLFFLFYSGALFFVPNNPLAFVEYSAAIKIHFVASIVTVTVLSYFYEHSTQRSYNKLLSVSLELEKITFSDFLTGLANRRKILQQIKYEKDRNERYPHVFSIILCDIDYFKKINDTYGHDCGDLVLKAIASALTESLRKLDIVSRWGGEEFLILLPFTNHEKSLITAERLRKNIEQLKIQYNGEPVIKVTMSFGVTTWKDIYKSIDGFIKQADENLYRAKEEGRNRIVAN